MYDLIIIGAGPAGITAAIYAARRKLKFLLVTIDVGGQVVWSSEVENYPGTLMSTGIDLVQKFQAQLKKYKVDVKQEEVLKISKVGGVVKVKTKGGVYSAKAVVVASGKKPKKLGVPGEEKFLGKGVNYCATCHAPSYKGKVVAIAGGGNSGLEAALFLREYAKKVYLLDINAKLGGEAHLRDRVLADKGIEVLNSVNISEIEGSNTVEGIRYLDGSSTSSKDGSHSKNAGGSTSSEKFLKIDGIFIEVGLVTEAGFVDVKKNKWGEIKLFRGTRTHNENLTSVPGIFAAGDCTDIVAKQIVAAAGEGCKAALAAMDYVLKK